MDPDPLQEGSPLVARLSWHPFGSVQLILCFDVRGHRGYTYNSMRGEG